VTILNTTSVFSFCLHHFCSQSNSDRQKHATIGASNGFSIGEIDICNNFTASGSHVVQVVTGFETNFEVI
jgi:hypothetical protein